MRVLLALTAALMLLSTSLASAAEIPAAFQGQWAERDATNFEAKWGVVVGPRTYYMPGMNCTINNVTNKPDSQNLNAHVIIIDMTCSDDANHATKRRETRAIRDGMLVTATPSSISIMQRGTLLD